MFGFNPGTDSYSRAYCWGWWHFENKLQNSRTNIWILDLIIKGCSFRFPYSMMAARMGLQILQRSINRNFSERASVLSLGAAIILEVSLILKFLASVMEFSDPDIFVEFLGLFWFFFCFLRVSEGFRKFWHWFCCVAGVGYAKNRSVQQCSGSVLVFCDADDISLKHRIISVCNALRNASRPELTLVGSGFERIPFGSTLRYTQWANTLSRKQIYDQVSQPFFFFLRLFVR